MKIVLISDVDVESGRGPVTRLVHVLPELSRAADVVLVALGPADEDCRAAIEGSEVRVHSVPFDVNGWRVQHLPERLRDIMRVVTAEQPDVVVLYREIWDLMHGLQPLLRAAGVPFLVMPHSVPFLDAMARPTKSFGWDLLRRLGTERRGHALRYLFTHVHQVGLMRTLPRIVINETVELYLDGYFPTAPSVRAIPGYAVNIDAITSARSPSKEYDVAFMAKLTPGKGVLDLLEVMQRLREHRPSARMLVIGSFESPQLERRFRSDRERLDLTGTVELAGWLSGRQKYQALSTARTFCYPSRSADTFSLCLLEALACGLPAVCYDAPFSRAVYGGTSAVRTVRFGANRIMADALDALLTEPILSESAAAARAFASQYSSWQTVAGAEISAYSSFLDQVKAPSIRRQEHS